MGKCRQQHANVVGKGCAMRKQKRVAFYENGWVGINQELEMTEMHDQTGIEASDGLYFNGLHKSDTALSSTGIRLPHFLLMHRFYKES